MLYSVFLCYFLRCVDEIAPKKYFSFPKGTTYATIFQAISHLLPTFGGRGVGAVGHCNGYAINVVWFSTANTHITFKESGVGGWLIITNTTGAAITAALYVELLDTH